MGARAVEHVCGRQDFTHAALTSGSRPALKTATGELLKHCGPRTVDFWCQGEELRVGFTVFDVKQPILSVSRLMDSGIETFIQTGKRNLLRFDGATVEITRRGGLFVLHCQVVLWMMSQREKLLISHLSTRRWSGKVTGREEVPTPVAIEVPAPGERPVKSGNVIDTHTHLQYQSWCIVCVRARGKGNRHKSRSQFWPGTPVIQCDCCFLKTQEDAPMITVLVAIFGCHPS